MTQPNLSDSTNGAEQHSAFHSAQSALARKPLPGPRWAWPGVAALAVAGVAYLVAGTSGEHAGHKPAPSPSAEGAPTEEAANPVTTTTAALQPAAPEAAPTTPPAAPAPPAPAPASDVAAAPPKAEAEPAKPSDAAEAAVASAAPTTKKKARGHRAKRKRSAPAE
jgi:hypothetical protein